MQPIIIENIFSKTECEFIQKLIHYPESETAKVEVNESYIENFHSRK